MGVDNDADKVFSKNSNCGLDLDPTDLEREFVKVVIITNLEQKQKSA